MRSTNFREAIDAAVAGSKRVVVRDEVRKRLDEIRRRRAEGMTWDILAEALTKDGVTRQSGRPITGAGLCRMVGEIERVDEGVHRPVGRPRRIGRQLAAGFDVMPLAHPGTRIDRQETGQTLDSHIGEVRAAQPVAGSRGTVPATAPQVSHTISVSTPPFLETSYAKAEPMDPFGADDTGGKEEGAARPQLSIDSLYLPKSRRSRGTGG